MPEWFETLPGLLARGWQRMGEKPRGGGPVLVTFCTAGLEGGAEGRLVALRRAWPERGLLRVQTDLASAKIAEIAADPRVSLVGWWPDDQLQLRLRCAARLVTGAALDDSWRQMPDDARLNYGGTPEPGRPVARPEAYDKHPMRARFAAIDCELQQIDAVHLGEVMHRRALFRADDGFKGQWLAP